MLLCSAMDARRRVYCPEYQKKRTVKGRTQCPYPKWECPNGVHMCSSCGKPGHGSEDCRSTRPLVQDPPPADPRVSAPPGASAPVRPSCAPGVAQPRPEPSSSSSSGPQFVTGFGFKGEGKKGNYGIGIDPPSIVLPSDLPPDARSSVFGDQVDEDFRPWDPEGNIPVPIAPTTEEIESWMQSSFRKLTNISTQSPPDVGDSVLWRGVRTGKRGHVSTKNEYFNGKVRGMSWEGNELYIYVD